MKIISIVLSMSLLSSCAGVVSSPKDLSFKEKIIFNEPFEKKHLSLSSKRNKEFVEMVCYPCERISSMTLSMQINGLLTPKDQMEEIALNNFMLKVHQLGGNCAFMIGGMLKNNSSTGLWDAHQQIKYFSCSEEWITTFKKYQNDYISGKINQNFIAELIKKNKAF